LNAGNGEPFTSSTTQTGGFLTITLRAEVSGPQPEGLFVAHLAR
jgi:hypothetical protein